MRHPYSLILLVMLSGPSETLLGCRYITTRSRQKSGDEVNLPVGHAPEEAFLNRIYGGYMCTNLLRVKLYK